MTRDNTILIRVFKRRRDHAQEPVLVEFVHVLKSGCRWQDYSPEYGPHTTIYNQFARWTQRGIWENLFPQLAGNGRSADTQISIRPGLCSSMRLPPIPRWCGITVAAPAEGTQAMREIDQNLLYVDRTAKKPADLPVQAPTKFEPVLNRGLAPLMGPSLQKFRVVRLLTFRSRKITMPIFIEDIYL